jgi:hypothetical protein
MGDASSDRLLGDVAENRSDSEDESCPSNHARISLPPGAPSAPGGFRTTASQSKEESYDYPPDYDPLTPAKFPTFYMRRGTGTFFGTVANLVNSAVGAGMLSLPFAYQCSGVVMGSLMLILFGALASLSLHVIGRVQKRTNAKTFQECVAKVLGRRAEVAVTCAQLVFFPGICVAFLDIIPDQIVPVLSQWTSPDSLVAQRELIIVFVAVICLLPLMFLRNIQKLSPLATFSVAACVYTVFMFLARAVSAVNKHGWPDITTGEPSPLAGTTGFEVSLIRYNLAGIIKSVPLFSSAYFVHTTYPLVFAELAKRKLSRYNVNRKQHPACPPNSTFGTTVTTLRAEMILYVVWPPGVRVALYSPTLTLFTPPVSPPSPLQPTSTNIPPRSQLAHLDGPRRRRSHGHLLLGVRGGWPLWLHLRGA